MLLKPHPSRPLARPPAPQEHPWFKQDLPPGSLEYNDWALQLQITPTQNEDEVKAIIDQARRPPAPLPLYPDSDLLLGAEGCCPGRAAGGASLSSLPSSPACPGAILAQG